MKARPILFSAPMVRALLDGRKTQTRRIMKPQPSDYKPSANRHPTTRTAPYFDAYNGGPFWCWWSPDNRQGPDWIRCPYGVPGDLLVVREEHYRFGHWETVPGVKTATGRMKWRFVADTDELRFAAPMAYRGGRHHKDPATPAWHKRLARFMPMRDSRLTLEITDVRVERLQDISHADAIAEGLQRLPASGRWVVEKGQQYAGLADLDPRLVYQWLWEAINGPDSWAANPWVWAVSFKVHRANVDRVLAQLEAAA